VIARLVLVGAVGTQVLAASAVSACPPGIDVHLETPRDSPFVARPQPALSLKLRTAHITDVRTTGALDTRTVRRQLDDSAVGSCLRGAATSTFRITDTGSVTNVTVTSDDDVQAACLQTAFGAARMPAASGDTFVHVTIGP
jgi:hypothetical protein